MQAAQLATIYGRRQRHGTRCGASNEIETLHDEVTSEGGVGVIDRTTFPAASNSLESGVEAGSVSANAETSTIRLLNGRFEVRIRYRNQFTSPAGEGYLNARSIASSPTTETAVFFFGENIGSSEWMVRFSDARPFANRIDFFHGGLSDVELAIEVLDRKTGKRKEYHKGPFSLTGQVDRSSYAP